MNDRAHVVWWTKALRDNQQLVLINQPILIIEYLFKLRENTMTLLTQIRDIEVQ